MKTYKIFLVIITLIFSSNFSFGQWNNSLPVTTVSPLPITVDGMYIGSRGNSYNTALGINALAGPISASGCTAIGDLALSSLNNYNSQGNTAVGTQALQLCTTGRDNTAMGAAALLNDTSGYSNVSIGWLTATANVSGNQNTALGRDALGASKASNDNTAIGYRSLFSFNGATAGNNVAVGSGALQNLVTGNNNIGIGFGVQVTDLINDQLNIQNVIRGTNMSSAANGYVGIGLVPSVTGTVSKLHVGTNAAVTVPSLQLDYIPTTTNTRGRYLFTDGAGIVSEATLPAAGITSTCVSVGGLPMVASAGSSNLTCSHVYDNSTTVAVGVTSAATYSWVSNTGGEYGLGGTSYPGSTYAIPTGTNYTLYVNGWTGGTGYIALSDERLKKNIKKIGNPLEKISKINGYTYNWNLNYKTDRKLDSARHAGFLAQELQEILPEAVVKSNDGILGLNYNAIMPLLTEGIKAQQSQIETQQIKIADLESKLADLTSKVNQLIPGYIQVKGDKFQIVPNPVTGTSIVSYKLAPDPGKAVFIVYDLQGKMLKRYEIPANAKEGQIQLNKKELGNGMYILSLLANNVELQSKRFIIAD